MTLRKRQGIRPMLDARLFLPFSKNLRARMQSNVTLE